MEDGEGDCGVTAGGEVADEEAGAGAGEAVVGDAFCACSLCERRTWIRPVTYSRTWMRISIPGLQSASDLILFADPIETLIYNAIREKNMTILTNYQRIWQHGCKTSQQPAESASNIKDLDVLH